MPCSLRHCFVLTQEGRGRGRSSNDVLNQSRKYIWRSIITFDEPLLVHTQGGACIAAILLGQPVSEVASSLPSVEAAVSFIRKIRCASCAS